jgi:hypothetical protein
VRRKDGLHELKIIFLFDKFQLGKTNNLMKPLPAELEAKIDEIRSWMFGGYQRVVAQRAGTTEGVVSLMLNKKRTPSDKVIEAGLEVMNERKAKFECAERRK